MAGDKNIFDVLKEYKEHYERPLPIKYDLLYFSDDHRKFDALIRRYWIYLHPLTKDLFTSFANEFQYIITLLEENQEKLKVKEKEVEELTKSVSDKLQQFETTFENRILDGISNIQNSKFDELYENNQNLTEEIHLLNEELRNKEELIRNLRNELSLIIDDSDKQAETAKLLEDNIVGSIEHFDTLSKQLDTFEFELNNAQKEKEIAGEKINKLVNELEEKDHQLDELKKQYEEKLIDSESRFNTLKAKVREISPNIEKIHAQSRQVNQENSRLAKEIEQLKSENEQLKSKIQEVNINEFERMKVENINLTGQNTKLNSQLDMITIKSLHQQTLIDEYKSLRVNHNKTGLSASEISKHPNQSLPKPQREKPPVKTLQDQIGNENRPLPNLDNSDEELLAIKAAMELPITPDEKVSESNQNNLDRIIENSDRSDVKLAIQNTLALMRKEDEQNSKKNNKDKTGSLSA